MESQVHDSHFTDEDGNPAGGTTYGRGFAIGWHNGPLSYGDKRLEPNGAFVEDVIEAAIGRLEYYEGSRFDCEENRQAIRHLEEALRWLSTRTSKREAAGVEGTYEVH